MDEFDFREERPRRRFRAFDAFWNLGSLILLLAAVAAGVYITQIFMDPFSSLNPLPPFAAPTQAPASPTLPEASATLFPSETPEEAVDTATPAATPIPGSYFGLQDGSPVYLDSSIFHPELGCAFSGIAGQAFGPDGAPIAGLRVQVTGSYDGQPIDKTGLTGAATEYGAGSYFEVVLGSQPLASTGELQIILRNESGAPISDPFSFDTRTECSSNLILLNFRAQP
jgi:hypothetical protein